MSISTAASESLILICTITMGSGHQPSSYLSWALVDGTGASGAQTTSQVSTDQKSEPKHKQPIGKKIGTPGLKGRISDDGKIFVTDEDHKAWSVSNPEALKGHEGHKVTLYGQIDEAKGEIHVASSQTAGIDEMKETKKTKKTKKRDETKN